MKSESQKQLDLIEEMIAQTKTNISEGSIFYLLWGWLVVIAAGLHYFLLNYSDYNHPYIAWPILMTLGAVISAVIGNRQEKKKRVKTFVDRAIGYLWLGFTISLILVLVCMIKIRPEGAYPIVILLYGLGTFVSGGILKFPPLIWGGIVSWLLGLAALFVSFSDQLLLIIAAVVFSYIIPGYLLSKSKKHV